jgi:hypothetical protein
MVMDLVVNLGDFLVSWVVVGLRWTDSLLLLFTVKWWQQFFFLLCVIYSSLNQDYALQLVQTFSFPLFRFTLKIYYFEKRCMIYPPLYNQLKLWDFHMYFTNYSIISR